MVPLCDGCSMIVAVNTRLHAVIFAQTDNLLNEILVPKRCLARRKHKGVVCACADAYEPADASEQARGAPSLLSR